MKEVKTLTLPEAEPQRSEAIKKILEDYTIISMSEDNRAVTVVRKEGLTEVHPKTGLPVLYD
jgi:hypothetical protein